MLYTISATMLSILKAKNELDIVLLRCSSSLTFNKYLNAPWSIIKDITGINSCTKVITKSTVPYSSVDNSAVYKGKSRNVINCVDILPTVIINVFFVSSPDLLIFTPA